MRRSLATAVVAFVAAVLAVGPASASGGTRHLAGAPPRLQEEPKKKEKKPFPEGTPVIWRDPGAVETLDFVNGVGGAENAPQPPFTFIEEDEGGTNPKIKVRDAAGRRWSAKFGTEVNAETFASRIAWAAGYFVEPAYFVPSGKIEGVTDLKRAKRYVNSKGEFKDARFELKVDDLGKKKDENGWSWPDNPFVGTKELNGMKVVLMLISNWDNKDARDASRGSNTAIVAMQGPNGVEHRYMMTDWGGSMGKWGSYFSREKWDAKGYAGQTKDFLKVNGGALEWGYKGQHSAEFYQDVKPSDVVWITQYLSRVTDEQLRAGLRASGASDREVDTFTQAIRSRIEQLKQVQ